MVEKPNIIPEQGATIPVELKERIQNIRRENRMDDLNAHIKWVQDYLVRIQRYAGDKQFSFARNEVFNMSTTLNNLTEDLVQLELNEKGVDL